MTVELALIGQQRPDVLEALSREFVLHRIHDESDPLAALEQHGPRVRGALGHGMAGLKRAHIERLPQLEIFAIAGVGLETTDLAACKERGIVVTTTPVLFDDVADLAIALALAACRQIPTADQFVRTGHWLSGRMPLGRKFTGMRAGIVGLGRIGREVARRLEGFKLQIAYTDPHVTAADYARVDDPLALARDSDILFLCAAGGPRGAGPPLIGASMLEALGPTGIFINVARGWLVDEAALIAALHDRRLGAAGLDVFDDEPRVPDLLRTLPNVVLTPHIASSTDETMRAMSDNVIANITSWFGGRGAVTAIDSAR